MTIHFDNTCRRGTNCVQWTIGLVLIALLAVGSSVAQTESGEGKPASGGMKPGMEYRTFYLAGITQQTDANDLQTDLRNMLPMVKIYGMPSQNAISMRGSAEDLQLAGKIIGDLDRARKSYRLTYTITESDGGKPTGVQHVALVVLVGGRTTLKQGVRLPIVTGSGDGKDLKDSAQVQYIDIGLNIDANLDGYPDGLRLKTKIEQSGLADDKSGLGPGIVSGLGSQDPVIRQTTLEATSTLMQGKAVVLGSLDVPGTTKREQIEVVSEPVKE